MTPTGPQFEAIASSAIRPASASAARTGTAHPCLRLTGVPAKSRPRRITHETLRQTATHSRLTTIATINGPKNGDALNSPCQAPNADPTSSMCPQIRAPTSSSSCIASAVSPGPITPMIPFRVATEKSTPMLANASAGNTHSSQLASTRPSEPPDENNVPLRLTSGWPPITITPATMLATAVAATSATTNVAAASSLPANTSPKVQERVRTHFQVP